MVKAAAQPCISPLTHERCPTHAQSRGADGVLSAPPATWRTGCGAKPHGVNKPLGGRVSRGCSVPKALILLGFLRLGIYANRRAVLRAGYAPMPHLCTCVHVHKCSRIRGSVCPLLRCVCALLVAAATGLATSLASDGLLKPLCGP